jgi:hypothetical protein
MILSAVVSGMVVIVGICCVDDEGPVTQRYLDACDAFVDHLPER